MITAAMHAGSDNPEKAERGALHQGNQLYVNCTRLSGSLQHECLNVSKVIRCSSALSRRTHTLLWGRSSLQHCKPC